MTIVGKIVCCVKGDKEAKKVDIKKKVDEKAKNPPESKTKNESTKTKSKK